MRIILWFQLVSEGFNHLTIAGATDYGGLAKIKIDVSKPLKVARF